MAPPQVRTVTLQNWPAGAAMVGLAGSATTSWTPGSWVEFVNPVPTGGIQVAGMALDWAASTISALERFIIDFGVGAAGSEVVVSQWYAEIGNPGNQGPAHELFPLPISLFTAGSRVAVRIWMNATANNTLPIAVLYYNGLDSTYFSSTALQHYPLPVAGNATAGTGRVAFTPSNVAWTNTAYTLLSPTGGWSEDVVLAHLNLAELPNADWEFDIAFGAGPTLKTTEAGRPQAGSGNTYLSRVLFDPVFTVPANTEVKGRLRKSDTTTTTVYASLNFYNAGPTVATDPGGGGTISASTDPSAGISLCGATAPIAWMTLTPSGLSTVYKWSKVPINHGTPDDPRVKTFGQVTRALSSLNSSADFTGSVLSPVIIDTDRALRNLEDTDSLINARVSVYLSTQAAIQAGSTPRRVFDGVVTDTEPQSGLLFQLQVSDYFASLLTEFAANHTFPQRVFNTTDFPNMGNATDLTNPGNAGMVGKPVPIGYGLIESSPVFVGRRTVGGFNWDEYIVAGHAPSPGGALRIDGDIGGVRSTFTEDMYGVDIIAPGHEPSWTSTTGSSHSYQDYNGNRYFSIFARGPRSDSAIQGRIPFVVRWGGRESTGDGSGTMIDGLLRQILHLMQNDIFGGPYTSGAWSTGPVVPVDLYSRINTASFEAVQTQSVTYVGGVGFKGSFLLGWDGNTDTLITILQKASRSGGFSYGVNKDGQLIATMVNPSATVNRAIVDVSDVVKQTFRSRRRRDQIANTVTYRYGRFYAQPLTNATPAAGVGLPASNTVVANPDFASGDVTISDATSVTKYGARKFDLTLDFVADQPTADAVAQIQLQTFKNGPTIDTFTERLCGCDTELGARDTLTHFELPPTGGGGVARSMRCERHTLDLDALTVEKDYRDLKHVDFSGV